MSFDYNTKLAGIFTEKTFENTFEYKETNDSWALKNWFKHEIDCGHGQIRYGNVKKTIAYICVDELDGKLIIEKWNIKKHKIF